MRLRGAFNPSVQIVLGAVMILIFVAFVVAMKSWATDPEIANWLRLDLRMMPIALLLGMAVGLAIGKWRLQALRSVLLEVDGQLYLSEANVLRKTREGANAISLQRAGPAIAFVAMFGLATFTNGRIVVYGSMAAYILGQYLTGQTVPFVRLLLELRKSKSSAPSP